MFGRKSRKSQAPATAGLDYDEYMIRTNGQGEPREPERWNRDLHRGHGHGTAPQTAPAAPQQRPGAARDEAQACPPISTSHP